MNDNSFATWYVQHSKKLSIWGLAQWALIAIAVLFITAFTELDSYNAQVLVSVTQWSATLAGVVVSGYMLNSAAEKAFKQKITTAITSEMNDQQADKNEAGCG